DPGQEDDSAFTDLLAEVSRLFPLGMSRLIHVDAGDRALLLEWPGSDASLDPVILTAHFDVVSPGDPALWEQGPFSGSIRDGYVHGRGCQDIKITMVSVLEATERLLAEGFVPRRSVYLAFGGDEETGGTRGARTIAGILADRGIRAEFLLDEGGPVACDVLKFADRPLALVGISEKGYVDIAIEAIGSGGHASMPPQHTASGAVARTVALSENHPFPARISYTLARMLEGLCPYVPFLYRLLFRNLFMTAPLVKVALAASPATNALIRTTTAATMLTGSDKENVLPESAKAILNVRVLPGSAVGETMAKISSMAASCGASARLAHEGRANDPMPESPVDHFGYRSIEAAVTSAFPEAGTIPFMFTAGTDTKHYRNLTPAIYRFTPLFQTSDDIARI
ncbi:MAG TPA: M20/M25/M40 family metallo-hydrolase, partial [Desulfurivibrionaceae bacterium]|nr:M20/M25/M40 family metallo-hydrolase [Desulfurivibrionaceae bacterium]